MMGQIKMINYNVFKDGKQQILTMSYDDGLTYDRRLVEIFDNYGIRGTFNLSSGRLDKSEFVTKAEVKSLYKNHEVAIHTVSHNWLERMPTTDVIKEVLNDREALEKMCGYPVRGMAYPFGAYNSEVVEILKQCGIAYSRTTAATKRFTFPKDFLMWHPTCHHKDLLELAEEFAKTAKTTGQNHLFYVWGHSYEFERKNNWELIEDFCAKVSGLDNVWYATNIEIYDYLEAQKNLKITVDEKIISNTSVIPVWIERNGETIKIGAGETVEFI